jgi:transcriptional regulator with XRE-family HTH domain
MYEIFEQLLQLNNITPYRVAKETGIATATLSDWKNGKSTPKQDKLQKIADYFGVKIEYLMGREINHEDNQVILSDEELKRLKVFKVNDKLRILFDEAQDLEQSDIDFVLDMVKKIKK